MENKTSLKSKINISIFGTCVSREMFNEPRLQDVFNVSFYAFKVCPWALTQEGLNLPVDILKKAPLPEFTIRNLLYDLNKSLIETIPKQSPEFIMVDLYSFRDPLFLVTYNNKSVYIQTNDSIKSLEILKNYLSSHNIHISYERIDYSQVNNDLIKKGFNSFAEILNNNFKKIIIVFPQLPKRYFSIENKITSFSENMQKSFNHCEELVQNWTNYLISKISTPLILKWPQNMISRYIYDDLKSEPNAVHILQSNYEQLATILLDTLNINYKEYYTKDLDYIDYSREVLFNKLKILEQEKKTFTTGVFCNINTYTNFLKSLKNHLIIFCAHADAANKIKFFINRYTLNLKFNLNFRDSYIGIIDTKNNYTYENSSQEALQYTYYIPNTNLSVFIESHGFNAGNYSSIIFANKEYSKQKRGLNIFVLDLNTMSVIDYANCDTCLDDNLFVDSNLFEIFK